MYRIVGTLLLSLALVATGHAQDRRQVAEDLLRKSGLWDQLGSVEAQVKAGFADPGGGRTALSAAEAERVEKAIGFAFAPARLRSAALQVFLGAMDELDVESLQRWYASPTGVMMTRLEVEMSRVPVEPEALVARGAAILEHAAPRRRELLEALVRETRAAEAGAEIVTNISLAVQRGIASTTPGGSSGREPASAQAELEAQRPMLVQALSKLSLAAFAVMYRTASDADLERYVEFSRSPAGQQFVDVSNKALGKTLSKATEELGRRLPGTRDSANS